MKRAIFLLAVLVITGAAQGKVDLVTLPKRDMVQLTIYNSADMTLARESRDLTLKNGKNKLQFSWANTLIDPTSLEMLPKANADKIDIADLTYPPRVRNLGLWNIKSGVSGKVPSFVKKNPNLCQKAATRFKFRVLGDISVFGLDSLW